MTGRAALGPLAGILLLAFQDPAGRFEDFPSDEAAASWSRLGLFIGIDKYPRMKGRDLRGAAGDAGRLRELLAARFGFERTALLTDERATRENIGRMLQRLIQFTGRAASKSGSPPVVVLHYAGHGSYCVDQKTAEAGQDEAEGRDSTWVASDSTLEGGENDVRDDEIHAALSAISAAGAEVLFVSDSCHSGTVHRGADCALARNLPRKEPAPGPAASLFPLKARPLDAGPAVEAPRGVVALAACTDDQSARECTDASGAAWGRLTWTLHRLLATVEPSTTYEELFRRLAGDFASRGFTHGPFGQSPQLHGAAADRKRPILGGTGRPDPLSSKLAARFDGFRVRPADGLPDPVRAALKDWAEKGRFTLSPDPFDVAVHPAPSGVAVYPAESLPDAEGKGGTPLRTCADAAALGEALLELAIGHRLRAMDAGDGKIRIRLQAWNPGLMSPDPVDADVVEGVATLHDGQSFTLAVKNLGTEPVHVAFFDVDLGTREKFKGEAALLPFPPEDEGKVVPPGQEVEFFGGKAMWKVSAADHGGRHQLKAVATNVRIDFGPLLERGGNRAGNAADPVAFLKSAAAAAATRDPSAPRNLSWSTDTFIVDVAK